MRSLARGWRRGALSLSSPAPPLGLGGTPRPSGLPASAPHGAGPPKASRWRRGLSSPLTPRHWCCVKMRIPGTARSTSPRGSARRATRPRGVRASGSRGNARPRRRLRAGRPRKAPAGCSRPAAPRLAPARGNRFTKRNGPFSPELQAPCLIKKPWKPTRGLPRGQALRG